mgnify:CR=1 FL=1
MMVKLRVTLEQHRVCSKTGLALTSGPVLAHRIARASYGPLNPPVRHPHAEPAVELRDHVGSWGRYDTVGRTIYAADEPTVAFMEMLAPYRTKVADERRALQPMADHLGIPLDDLWRDIVTDWDGAGNMKASWLPRQFREGRALYTLSFPQGWWIEIAASETIAALHELFGGHWPTADGGIDGPLTLSHLTGDDRVLTTAIASRLRESTELDDGTLPLGVCFTSKHGHPSGGTGRCWAYWMRDSDNGLPEPTTVVSSSRISDGSESFNEALELCKIRSR